MPRVTGFLRVLGRGHPDQGLPGGEGPVDPDYGIGSEHPDNGLPPLGSGAGPDNGLPVQPPGVWPPLTPSHPIQPTPPSINVPPGTIWPPVFPPDPGYGVGIEHPDQGLPGGGAPPSPDHGLPGGSRPVDPGYGHSGTFWVVAGIPGVGWRYVCVDPSLKPGHPLPPTPQPK